MITNGYRLKLYDNFEPRIHVADAIGVINRTGLWFEWSGVPDALQFFQREHFHTDS